MYLENFVRFKNEQILTFKENENPYIFVGENGSGKTSVMEGIRRCLPRTTSTRWSEVFDESKNSIFICKYDVSKCPDLVLKNTEKLLFSGVITQSKKHDTSEYFKFVSTKEELFIDVYEKMHYVRSVQNTNTKSVCDIFEKLKDNKIEAADIINFDHETHSEAIQGSLEHRLGALEKYVVMTFPSRSIGPLQWSRSEKIDQDICEENYAEAGKRAEIIRYFLDHPGEFDSVAEQEIFRDLTGHDEIKFLYRDKHVTVESERSETRLPGGKFALLKLPEGTLEAKYFSILMANKNCQTLALEEPDKGMHPQMVERMLAVIQKHSYNKTVIMCTHNSYFVNPFTITRLLIFRKVTTTVNDKRVYHAEITSGNNIAEVKIPKESSQKKTIPGGIPTEHENVENSYTWPSGRLDLCKTYSFL